MELNLLERSEPWTNDVEINDVEINGAGLDDVGLDDVNLTSLSDLLDPQPR